ncbi:Endoribonuclease Dcr-1 [Eumeta japonica]|uniref:Endoribonuclease Dcr-1 n=1 Tax=Eumeta variegata TaxID=151549 RepID=A0A4C1TKW9_EUMVA|nr:Endoribonuclease Dcr-1 [Eumeta japonica]
MSRCDPCLKFIKCQFTTDRVADPITEPKEAESEHRRQEEVLKRFRMHDCNILVGTSILEEGIDVPKCNLVIRWDPPTTYRSYVQCKGKARAVPAYHVLLVAPAWKQFVNLNASNEQLNDESHRLICRLYEDESAYLSDADNSDRGDNSNADEKESKQINGVSMKQRFMYGSSKGTIKILNPEVITYKHPSNASTANAASPNLILKEIDDESLSSGNVKETIASENNEITILNEGNSSTLNNLIIINHKEETEVHNKQDAIDMEEINDNIISICPKKSESYDEKETLARNHKNKTSWKTVNIKYLISMRF